jgi:hypothetical protein
MELDELKNYWRLENEKLKDRIQLNENLIKKGYLDKTISEVDALLRASVLGRNLAFIYALISFTFTIILLRQIEFSIPCLLGGFAMLWSFKDHLSIARPNYVDLSIVELQKAIHKFRIHTSSRSTYDFLIVFIWFVTTIPAWMQVKHNTSVYSGGETSTTYFSIILGLTILLILPFKYIYNKYEKKLKDAETLLSQILLFEKA